MKYARIGAAALVLVFSAGMACAGPVPAGGMTVKDVAGWLQSKGFKAEIQQGKNGKPKIASATQGADFYVHFYDCKADRCASIQFTAGFTTHGTYSLEKENAWNNGNRWLTASMDQENDPWISMDVDLSPGGSYELLNDQFQVWNDSVARFEKTIKE
ncbi:MAG TPA: YbjN domain-containing protein [Rhizomicrobium sp.]|nr:YbjN domain-containing protein [Rhizomicrobium sp.]